MKISKFSCFGLVSFFYLGYYLDNSLSNINQLYGVVVTPQGPGQYVMSSIIFQIPQRGGGGCAKLSQIRGQELASVVVLTKNKLYQGMLYLMWSRSPKKIISRYVITNVKHISKTIKVLEVLKFVELRYKSWILNPCQRKMILSIINT